MVVLHGTVEDQTHTPYSVRIGPMSGQRRHFNSFQSLTRMLFSYRKYIGRAFSNFEPAIYTLASYSKLAIVAKWHANTEIYSITRAFTACKQDMDLGLELQCLLKVKQDLS